MGHSTGYAEVDAVLADLLAGVRGNARAAAGWRVSGRFARGRRFRGAQQRHRRPRRDGKRALRRRRHRARNDARAACDRNVEVGARARCLHFPKLPRYCARYAC